ncbi:MAG: Ig-like domain-containing protein, partial [Acidobacteriota bacterium]
QSDQLHPNDLGEQFIAGVFRATLETVLTPGNPAPSVALTAPSAGASFVAPSTVTLSATASDPNGTVAAVDFFVDGALLGTDSTDPYTFHWNASSTGTYVLTARATDDQGATRLSEPVTVSVTSGGGGTSIAVANPSFELPTLGDGAVRNATGVPDWTFVGTSATYRGVFNPPVGSYPTAGGQGTPPGADGAQVAFLFNNGGPSQSVTAHQDLGETVQVGRDYTLRVAIGRFDPGQPYAPSTYGGYRIELLAGGTVIATDVDTVDPTLHTFEDAVAVASSIPTSLVGQPLTIRLGLSTTQAQRSTHFDDVRLEASPAAGGNLPPSVTLTSPAAGTVLSPATLSLAATAADSDGTVAEVRFYAGATLLATDPTAPYSFDWTSVPAGTYALTAVAEDDGGATATSAAVTVVVEDPVTGGTVAVANPSFELPALTDGTVRNATGIPDWTFVGTSQTYRGVFNPPVGSYPTAGGQGTPPGADGAQVAFLFNNGGPSQSVTAHQDLGETVQAGRDYTLRVAIGKFDPGQPYAPSTYGGYRIELLAGGTVIASDVDTVDPALHTFEDAVAVVPAASIPPALVGQPL